jgi:hypothetical protein
MQAGTEVCRKSGDDFRAHRAEKFLRSVLRSSKILLQDAATLRNRIVPESFLIAGRQNVRHDSRRAAFEIAFPLTTAGNRLQVRRLELYGINCRTQFTKKG